MRTSAFFRSSMSNSKAYTELRTEPFIQSTGVYCFNSVNHNWVEVLSYSKYSLLFTCSQDWTCNLQIISLKTSLTKRQYLLIPWVLQNDSEWNFWTYKVCRYQPLKYYLSLLCTGNLQPNCLFACAFKIEKHRLSINGASWWSVSCLDVH